MDIINFLSKDIIIIIPILNTAGIVLKRTPRIPDWTIPYILCITGILLAIMILGINPNAILQGILLSMSSVGIHQVYKQGTK